MFEEFDDNSQIWIFSSEEKIEKSAQETLQTELSLFISRWKSHGEPVFGDFALLYNFFIIVGADKERSGVSGCSIDGVFRAVKAAATKAQVRLADSSSIYYRRDEEVCIASREKFQELVQNGEVQDDTLVFDKTIKSLAALRSSCFELPFASSWHAKAF